MQRRKPFWQLRSKYCKSRYSAKGSQVTRAGIVSDKCTGLFDQLNQSAPARHRHVLLPRCAPPALLVRVAGDLNLKALGAQALDQVSIALHGPDPDGLACARMDKNFAIRPCGWQPELFARRKLQSKGVPHHAPVFITMRPRLGRFKRVRKEELTAQAWKAEPRLDSKKPEQQVITRVTGVSHGAIPFSGQAKVEFFGPHLSPKPNYLAPGPDDKIIFMFERGPRGDESDDLDIWPETRLQILGVRFGQKRNIVFLARRLKERRSDYQIAHAPEFDD